eukprot:971039-Alexandrium_andersonii.AAC.1
MRGYSEGCSCARASSVRAAVPMQHASADTAAVCRMCVRARPRTGACPRRRTRHSHLWESTGGTPHPTARCTGARGERRAQQTVVTAHCTGASGESRTQQTVAPVPVATSSPG